MSQTTWNTLLLLLMWEMWAERKEEICVDRGDRTDGRTDGRVTPVTQRRASERESSTAESPSPSVPPSFLPSFPIIAYFLHIQRERERGREMGAHLEIMCASLGVGRIHFKSDLNPSLPSVPYKLQNLSYTNNEAGLRLDDLVFLIW